MPTDEKKELDIIETLLNDQSYDIEFNVFITNHIKQGVVALIGLEASAQRIKEYYDHYVKYTTYGFGLEPTKPSTHIITQDNWQVYFGKHCSFTSYCQFFDQKEKELHERFGKESMFLDEVFSAAKLPLIQFETQPVYSVADIQRALISCL
jgi:hypothetical protein